MSSTFHLLLYVLTEDFFIFINAKVSFLEVSARIFHIGQQSNNIVICAYFLRYSVLREYCNSLNRDKLVDIISF